MTKRIRKPPVQPETRQDWFQRAERYGESAPKIAEKDKVDVRTVRKHIELARREKDIREANAAVFRYAIQEHNQELCNFAQKLDSQLGSDRITGVGDRDNPLWLALHEHMPRSILWKNLDKWSLLRQQVQQLNRQMEKLLEDRIESGFKGKKDFFPEGLNKRIFYILNLHIKEAAQARPEILKKFDFEKVPESKDPEIKETINTILKEVAGWKDYNQLIQSSIELHRVNRILHDELLIITMRRVVPGRCRYCPV